MRLLLATLISALLVGCASAPRTEFVAAPAEPVVLPARPASSVRALDYTGMTDAQKRAAFARAAVADIVSLEGYAQELEALLAAINEGRRKK